MRQAGGRGVVFMQQLHSVQRASSQREQGDVQAAAARPLPAQKLKQICTRCHGCTIIETWWLPRCSVFCVDNRST